MPRKIGSKISARRIGDQHAEGAAGIIGASPVVVANVPVFSAAARTTLRARRAAVHKLRPCRYDGI